MPNTVCIDWMDFFCYHSFPEKPADFWKPVIVKEAGRKPPPFPFIFFKPSTTIHDHGEPVVIPKIAQNDQADYEGELVRSRLLTKIAFILKLTNLDLSAS